MEGDIITLQDIYKYDYKAMQPGRRRASARSSSTSSPTAASSSPAGCSAARTCGSDEAATAVPHPARAVRAGRRVLSAGTAHAQVTGRQPRGHARGRHVREHAVTPSTPPRRRPTSSSRRCLPDVRIGVETFGDDVTVLTPPTTDRALLERADQRDRRRRRHRALRRRGHRQPALHAGGREQGARAAVGRQGRRQHRHTGRGRRRRPG